MDDMNSIIKIIDKLFEKSYLEKDEFKLLIEHRFLETDEYLFEKAREIQHRNYGNDVYIRGLIEISNYCKNNCNYCGIRSGNVKADRYRLSKEQIVHCADVGYKLGFRTFVLQGGEDRFYTPPLLADIISEIKSKYPECAITLSVGEHSFDTYKLWFEAGADRYLLRHETADGEHYSKLHPENLTLENRQKCLANLKEIGYQVGTGFMVGSPWQTSDSLAKDLVYIRDLAPQMVGIGPFIPHKDTPFKDKVAGTSSDTVFFIGILRLLLPTSLLPATTALGTIDPTGREKAILAGANVIMPNLSPSDARHKYLLYNDKIATGDEAAESKNIIAQKMQLIGYDLAVSRGDAKGFNTKQQRLGERGNYND